MNTSCPASPIRPAAIPERGFLTSLQKLISTAGMTSVDLTDTIFANLPKREGAPYEAVVRAPSCSE